jgi:uncharacterized protein YdiU (UPF0061 family)
MRLIRSIKFGVAGTSMQPWGDQTSALQRMQLVMFIRSLSAEQKYREQLYTFLYRDFDESRVAIENGRIEKNPLLIKTKDRLNTVAKQQVLAAQKAELGDGSAETASQLYKEQLELTKQLKLLTENDAKYQQLIDLVYQERKIYEELGLSIIGLSNRDGIFDPFIKLLQTQGQKIQYAKGTLTFQKANQEEQNRLIDKIKDLLAKNINEQEDLLSEFSGKIPSAQQKERILEINGTLQNLRKLRNSIIAAAEETKRIDQKQQLILNELNNGTTNDNSNSDRPTE